MIPENPDVVMDAYAGLGRTQSIYHQVEKRVREKEQMIIATLVAAYNSGSAGDQEFRGGIAGIAALRSLLNDLKREATVATEKSRHLSA